MALNAVHLDKFGGNARDNLSVYFANTSFSDSATDCQRRFNFHPHCKPQHCSTQTMTGTTLIGGLRNPRCEEKCHEFTKNTSMHGVKYVWMKDSVLTRRLFWLLLVVTCSGSMLYQIVDRMIYYHSTPITVDVRINFNTVMAFPSVTICNQNAFRASQAAKLGIYDLLADLYNDSVTVKSDQLRKHHVTNMSMYELFFSMGHHIEDLLVSCQWRSQPCSHDDFSMVLTDHGLCYTLNMLNRTVDSADTCRLEMIVSVIERLSVSTCKTLRAFANASLVRMSEENKYPVCDDVDNTRTDGGLTLTLNVEQYEYMPGPHDAYGIKILIHDKYEVPNVHALGQALSAGVHSFLAIKLVAVENLHPPYGDCDSPRLTYYSHYRSVNCESECTTKLLEQLCQCKLAYMPGPAPVCTLLQYYECYIQNKDFLHARQLAECVCSVPCSFLVYDPMVSFAPVSSFVVGRFLADVNVTSLQNKFNDAREITHRFEQVPRQSFRGNLEELERSLITLQTVTSKEMAKRLRVQRNGLTDVSARVQSIYNRSIYLFEYQAFIVENDFVLAADAMSDQTFNAVASDMQEFSHKMDSMLKQLVDPSLSDPAIRKYIFVLLTNEINGKFQITQTALENVSILCAALNSSVPMFNYTFNQEPADEAEYIVPVPLFRKAWKKTGCASSQSRGCSAVLENILSNLRLYRDMATEAFDTNAKNTGDMSGASTYFRESCKQFLQCVDTLYKGLQYAVTYMQERQENFSQHWRQFMETSASLNQEMDSLESLAQGLNESLFQRMTQALQMSKAFLLNGSATKRDIAQLFTSTDVKDEQDQLQQAFDEMRTRAKDVYDLWGQLELDSQLICNATFTDENLQTYYRVKNVWGDLGNLTGILAQLQEVFDRNKAFDVQDALQTYDAEFLHALQLVITDMKDFLDTGHVDADFIRNNFLRLNIFYRELNYEQITQQHAYDIFALFCDIGGSMGLFLGASVVTVFELADLLFSVAKTSMIPKQF